MFCAQRLACALSCILLSLPACMIAQSTGDMEFVNGSLYQDLYPGAKGHPFFGHPGWEMGYVDSPQGRFDSITIKYDICIDRVIYNHVHPAGIYGVKLNPGAIPGFGIEGHHFIWLEADSKETAAMKAGYYERVCAGKASLYRRWYKTFDAQANQSRGKFTENQDRYIRLGNTWYPVKGRQSIIRVFGDYEKEIRNFIHQNQLNPVAEDINDLRRVVEYYNSL